MIKFSPRVFVLSLLFTMSLVLNGCDDGTGPTLAPPGARIEFEVPPHDVVTGTPFKAPVSLRLVDAAGELLMRERGDVVLSLVAATGNGSLTGLTTVPLVDGVASFPDLTASGASTSARLVVHWRDLGVESDVFAIAPDPDVVATPTPGVQGLSAVFLVDGTLAGAYMNDSVFTALSSITTVGAVRSATQRNEIVAFVPGYAPVITPAPWTMGVDTVAVPERETVILPVTIWVIYGPFSEAESTILQDVEVSNDMLEEQRAGLRIEAEVVDLTDHPEAGGFLDLESEVRLSGITGLGYTPRRINVYAVRNIILGSEGEGMVTLGHAEIGGDLVAVAELGWGRSTFLHELAHTLSLAHVNDVDGFGEENLMRAGGSPERRRFTEGQTFRMHFDRGSALAGMLGRVDFSMTRACRSGLQFHSAGCIREELDLFPEATASVAQADPVFEYLSWDCGIGQPPRPEAAAEVWERAFRHGPGRGFQDPAFVEFYRLRALGAWAAVDPDGALPILRSLVGSENPRLARAAERLLATAHQR